MARQGKNRPPAKTGSATSGASAHSASAPTKRKGVNPLRFFSEVRQEGRKVTWTPRRETIISTIMVLIVSIIAAIFFFAVDSLLGMTIEFILSLGA